LLRTYVVAGVVCDRLRDVSDVIAAHRLQILQVDVLVAEAVEAYNIGELQREVNFTSAVFTRYFIMSVSRFN